MLLQGTSGITSMHDSSAHYFFASDCCELYRWRNCIWCHVSIKTLSFPPQYEPSEYSYYMIMMMPCNQLIIGVTDWGTTSFHSKQITIGSGAQLLCFKRISHRIFNPGWIKVISLYLNTDQYKMELVANTAYFMSVLSVKYIHTHYDEPCCRNHRGTWNICSSRENLLWVWNYIYLMHPWVTFCMIKNLIIHLYQPRWCFCQASIC